MKITPVNNDGGTYRTGTILGLSEKEITEKLGFKPDLGEDKSLFTWTFKANGKFISIWDYKGSSNWLEFSTYGDSKVLSEIFGDDYSADRR